MKRVTSHRLFLLPLMILLTSSLQAGVRKEIQKWYEQQYLNKALYLRVPVHGEREVVRLTRTVPFYAPHNGQGLKFKVGEQVRITRVDFRGDAIRMRVSSIDTSQESEIEFLFPAQLSDGFPQRGLFDVALEKTFTEGLSYTDLDEAREEFIRNRFYQFVGQLSLASNTGDQEVIRILTGSVTELKQVTDEKDALQRKVTTLQGELEEEKQARARVESEVRRLGAELDQSRTSLGQLRDELNRARADAAHEIRLLTNQNKDFEEQVKKLMRSLDVKSSSTDSLGRQVEALQRSLEALQEDKQSLSRRLQGASQELAEAKRETEKIAADLRSMTDERDRLFEDVKSLTTNRKGLESRYIETKREKERLERVAELTEALELNKRVEERPEGRLQVADVYLVKEKIGTLVAQVPEYGSASYAVRFQTHSPETVKFSDQERKLYQALGEELKVETNWRSANPNLRIVLVKGEAIQSVAPRESAEWEWLFEGEVMGPQQVTLEASLLDPSGHRILLGTQDFTLNPGDTLARVGFLISPASVAAGALLGFALFGLLFGFKGRSRARANRAAEAGANFVVQKKL